MRVAVVGSRTVSYTHLDVYKRQSLNHPKFSRHGADSIIGSINYHADNADAPVPVGNAHPTHNAGRKFM